MNGKEDLDAKLKNVQIISGKYNLPKQTASMVLHPCNIELTRHRENSKSVIEMQLKVSDMYLNIAALDIHICLDVWNVIQEDKGQGKDFQDSGPSNKQYYDLWNTKGISKQDWLKPDDPGTM